MLYYVLNFFSLNVNYFLEYFRSDKTNKQYEDDLSES